MALRAPRNLGQSPESVAFAAGLIVYLACLAWLPHFIERLTPLTGDEPFYVMTAISLIEDGDLDETNNYAERDYDRFYPEGGPTDKGWDAYPDPLPPHATQSTRPGLYSKHGLGLTLLIALPYAVGGRPLTLVVLALVAALIAANMALLARRYSGSNAIALVVALALSLTAPLLPFSLLIFPEMPAALCIVYALRRLLEPRNAWWQWLLIGCGSAALPWLHYRLVPVSLSLAAIAVILHRHTITRWQAAAALTAPAVGAVSLVLWFTYLYGRPLPPAADHAGFSGPLGTINGLAGLFLDQQWGAWIANPLLFLAVATAILFATAYPRDAVALAVVAGPYLGIVAAYRVWWGEWNPPARYLVDVVPLVAASLAWWLGRASQLSRWIALALTMIPAAAVMATFIDDPQLMYNHPDGTARLFENWAERFDLPLDRLIPSYVFYSASPASERLFFALAAIAWLAAVTYACWLAVRSTQGSTDPPTVQPIQSTRAGAASVA